MAAGMESPGLVLSIWQPHSHVGKLKDIKMDVKNLIAFAKSKPTGEFDDLDEDLETNEGNVEADPEKFATLLPLLEAFSIEIEDCCNEVDPDALRNPSMELHHHDGEIIRIGLENLDTNLCNELKRVAKLGITPEEAGNLGDYLENEKLVGDGGRVGGWLYRVGQALQKAKKSPTKRRSTTSKTA